MKVITIILFVVILVVGLVDIIRNIKWYNARIDFASEYRNKFVDFANKYFGTSSRFDSNGEIDNELYQWLTKRVDKIQAELGHFGKTHYIGPFRQVQVPNYEVVLNTLPKFRDGTIKNAEGLWVDDALTRYIGSMESRAEEEMKKLKNPFIWFREGFQALISFPLYLMKWFGIITDTRFSIYTSNLLYRTIGGIAALVTFLSGIVTMIAGKEQTMTFLKTLFK